MSDTIRLPGIGETKKPIVYAAGLATIVLTIYLYRQHANNAATTAAAPATTDPNNPDYSASGGMGAYYGSNYGGSGGNYGGNWDPSQGPPTHATISTNAQWTNAALHHFGHNHEAAKESLSRYITGQTIERGSQDETIVHEAIALVGLPPVAGKNGFPPSIHLVAKQHRPPNHHKKTIHYTTKEGDTLAELSKRFYGNENRWTEIRRANRGKFDARSNVFAHTPIRHGIVLTIPDAVYHINN